MRIIKNRPSTLKPISNIMDDAIKDVASIIGYEQTMLLKDWRKAFPAGYTHMLSFDKMQKKKDGSTILYLKAENSSISFLIHYEKLVILEKLATIVGSKIITDFKISANS